MEEVGRGRTFLCAPPVCRGPLVRGLFFVLVFSGVIMKSVVRSISSVSPLVLLGAIAAAVIADVVALATRSPVAGDLAMGMCGLALVAYGLTVDPEMVDASSAPIVVEAPQRRSEM